MGMNEDKEGIQSEYSYSSQTSMPPSEPCWWAALPEWGRAVSADHEHHHAAGGWLGVSQQVGTAGKFWGGHVKNH